MENRTDYKVTIAEVSREITAREKLMLKDTSNAIKLDEVVEPGSKLVIKPSMHAVLNIHNEKSDNVDYENIVIIDEGGNKYITGSKSFADSYFDIRDEMADEEYEIEVYKIESKNYKGKYFLTCSIV